MSGALLQPGDNPAASPTNDAYLPVSATMISQGGFASLTLNASQSGSVVTFAGNTTLTLPGQFVIENTGTIVVPSGVTAVINANYVQWSNVGVSGAPAAPLGNVLSFTSTVPVATGLQTLTVQQPQAGLFYVGEPVTLADSENSEKGTDNEMTGTVVSYNSATGALAVNVTSATGSDPVTSWSITPLGGEGILAINANTMDLVGALAVQDAQRAAFNVAGDLRLTGQTINGATIPAGSLVSYQQLDFAAGQLYPTTDTNFTLASASKIVFAANGAPLQAPLSAGGVLNIDAPEIDQSGTLRAPTGSINLGSATAQTLDGVSVGPTTTLNLGAGSLTSVSADGETSLFGFVQNGTDWYYNTDPSDVNLAGSPLSAPPAKVISLISQDISVASGATIDELGGGDLYAGAFVPGTGGSTNVFAGSNVYAVIPGYGGVTPYDPALSAGLPAVGRQIYLNGVPGLPAGTCTLLPGQYAELPGAFLVTLQTAPGESTASATHAPLRTSTLPDGSSIASGYFVTPGAASTDEHWSVFDVMSDAVARKYSEIDNYYANSFFAAQAAASGSLAPRLPQDAGQLSIAASGSLSFHGTGDFTHPNGLGGLADISADQILVVDDTTAAAIAAGSISAADYAPGTVLVGGDSDPDNWDPIVLGADDLNRLGVESLLLGGSRSFQSDGIHFTAVASAVVVANDGNDPLVLPDIQLIAAPELDSNTTTSLVGAGSITLVSTISGTGQVIIAPNAVIEASGAVAAGEVSTYILSTTPQTPPLATESGGSELYNINDVTGYYQGSAANQFGYVRISGGGLVTIEGGYATDAGVPASVSSSSNTVISGWGGGSTLTLTTSGNFAVGNWLHVTGSGGQIVDGEVTAVNGNVLTVSVFDFDRIWRFDG